jgi:hypothetical protein
VKEVPELIVTSAKADELRTKATHWAIPAFDPSMNTDHPGHIVSSILESIRIRFCCLVQKPAKQRGAGIPLGGTSPGSGLRLLCHP